MQNIKDAANAATEKVKGIDEKKKYIELDFHWITCSEVASGASYEANKEATKNENLSAGNRIGHGIDAAKDKSTRFYRLKIKNLW